MYMYIEHRICFQLSDNSENRNRPSTMDAALGAYFYMVLVHIETCQCICTNTHGQTWSSGAHVVFLLELQPSYRYGRTLPTVDMFLCSFFYGCYHCRYRP